VNEKLESLCLEWSEPRLPAISQAESRRFVGRPVVPRKAFVRRGARPAAAGLSSLVKLA
jgi:hypothetical protein